MWEFSLVSSECSTAYLLSVVLICIYLMKNEVVDFLLYLFTIWQIFIELTELGSFCQVDTD